MSAKPPHHPNRPRIHDDNPDPAGRGEGRGAIRRAPRTGDVVGRASRPGPYDSDDDDGPSAEDIERFGDVTRSCPECGKDVFDESAICYHCGHAFERGQDVGSGKNRLWVVATVVVLIGIFVFAALRGII